MGDGINPAIRVMALFPLVYGTDFRDEEVQF